jgi:hypothetical protein
MYMPLKIIRDVRKKIRLKTMGLKHPFYILMHIHNGPSRNGPSSKRPITERLKIKTTQAHPSSKRPKLKTTQGTERPKAQNNPKFSLGWVKFSTVGRFVPWVVLSLGCIALGRYEFGSFCAWVVS